MYDRYPGAPLISAIHDGNLDKVKLLLDEGEDIEQVVGDYTPLMHAINTNNTEISLYLIEQGANVHATLRRRAHGLHCEDDRDGVHSSQKYDRGRVQQYPKVPVRLINQ